MAVLGLGIPFLVYYVAAYYHFARQGYRVSWQKVILLVITGSVSVYVWGFRSFFDAFWVMNFFHALQYFAIVFHTEKSNLVRLFRVERLAVGAGLMLIWIVALTFAYGFWAAQYANGIAGARHRANGRHHALLVRQLHLVRAEETGLSRGRWPKHERMPNDPACIAGGASRGRHGFQLRPGAVRRRCGLVFAVGPRDLVGCSLGEGRGLLAGLAVAVPAWIAGSSLATSAKVITAALAVSGVLGLDLSVERDFLRRRSGSPTLAEEETSCPGRTRTFGRPAARLERQPQPTSSEAGAPKQGRTRLWFGEQAAFSSWRRTARSGEDRIGSSLIIGGGPETYASFVRRRSWRVPPSEVRRTAGGKNPFLDACSRPARHGGFDV